MSRGNGEVGVRVMDALRSAWSAVDPDVRQRYGYGRRDPGLPSTHVAKGVLSEIFPRGAESEYGVRWVADPDHWTDLVDERVAQQIADGIRRHARYLAVLPLWRAALSERAAVLDVGLPPDEQQRLNIAIRAALRAPDPDDPGADGSVRVIDEELTAKLVEARTVAQLNAALEDPDVVDRVTAILGSWRPVTPSLDAAAESRDWDWLLRSALDLLGLPVPRGARSRSWEALSSAWTGFAAWDSAVGFEHASRAAEMRLQEEKDVVGGRHPVPPLGGPPGPHLLPRPLDRTIYQRVWGLLRGGTAERRSAGALPPVDELLRRTAAQALLPFSLHSADSRQVLVLAHAAVMTLDDTAQPTRGTVLARIHRTLVGPLRRLQDRTGAGRAPEGDRGPEGGDPLPTAAGVALYALRLREHLDPARVQEDFMRKLWVALHTRGLQAAGDAPLTYPDVQQLLLRYANRVAKEAARKASGGRPSVADSEDSATRPPALAEPYPYTPEEVRDDVGSILPYLDAGDFLPPKDASDEDRDAYRELAGLVLPNGGTVDTYVAFQELLTRVLELESRERLPRGDALALGRLRTVADRVWRSACAAAREDRPAPPPPTLDQLLALMRRFGDTGERER